MNFVMETVSGFFWGIGFVVAVLVMKVAFKVTLLN